MSLKLPGRLIGPARTFALVAAGACALAACDTTAFVSPKNRDLTSIESTGLVGETCTYGEGLREETYRLRFTARDTDRSLIVPGDRLVGFTVELGESFRVSDISVLGEAGTIYPAPDIECASDADCDAAGLNGFTCGRLDRTTAGDSSSPTVCGRDMTVTVRDNTPLDYIPALPEDDNGNRDIIVMAANGASLLGVLPSGRVDPPYSTDPENQRTSAIGQFIRRLGADAELAPGIEVCVATFGDSTASVSFLDQGTPGGCFRAVDSSSSLSGLTTDLNGALQRPDPVEMNYWAALQAAIDYAATYGRASADQHVVLFLDTDMTDEDIRDEASVLGQTFERTLQEAQAAGVTVHVVQLDNEPDCPPVAQNICSPCENDGACGGDGPRCGDVGGTLSCMPTCRNDSECPSGFTCDETTLASGELADLCLPVGGSCAGDCIDPDGDGYGVGSACLGTDCHEGNPSGHGVVAPVGPIADLADLACTTEGTFFYTESPAALVEAFTNLGVGLPASYELVLGISDIGLQPLGQYKMAFTMSVSMNETTETYDFGGAVAAGASRADRRTTINLGGVCSADTDCLPNLTCIGGECVPRATFGSALPEGSGGGT